MRNRLVASRLQVLPQRVVAGSMPGRPTDRCSRRSTDVGGYRARQVAQARQTVATKVRDEFLSIWLLWGHFSIQLWPRWKALRLASGFRRVYRADTPPGSCPSQF